mmetsp:Transcript_5093/g.11127  ORF Transcript_5093/g.11127 Transcript_5093/m.11127 type:complete len:105 (+) Transcript_5093:263-577(+)
MDREINQSLQDKEIRAQIEARLRDSGEREKLKALLRDRLIDCGWRDDLKEHCKDLIRKKGLSQINVEDLVKEITPKGRAMVPDAVKAELLTRIRNFLANDSDAN